MLKQTIRESLLKAATILSTEEMGFVKGGTGYGGGKRGKSGKSGKGDKGKSGKGGHGRGWYYGCGW